MKMKTSPMALALQEPSTRVTSEPGPKPHHQPLDSTNGSMQDLVPPTIIVSIGNLTHHNTLENSTSSNVHSGIGLDLGNKASNLLAEDVITATDSDNISEYSSVGDRPVENLENLGKNVNKNERIKEDSSYFESNALMLDSSISTTEQDSNSESDVQQYKNDTTQTEMTETATETVTEFGITEMVPETEMTEMPTEIEITEMPTEISTVEILTGSEVTTVSSVEPELDIFETSTVIDYSLLDVSSEVDTEAITTEIPTPTVSVDLESENVEMSSLDFTSEVSTEGFTTDVPMPPADSTFKPLQNLTPKNDTSKGLEYYGDLILEASPTMEEVADVTNIPSVDPTKYDFKIVTTRKGLQVDAPDTVLDPSQIARATSYEGSPYSTATRSATVMTWVAPNDTNTVVLQGTNMTNQTRDEDVYHGPAITIRMPSHTLDTGSNVTTQGTMELDLQSGSNETTLTVPKIPDDDGRQDDRVEGIPSGKSSEVDQILPAGRDEKFKITKETGGGSGIIVEALPKLLNTTDSADTNLTHIVYELPKLDERANTGAKPIDSSVILIFSICCGLILVIGVVGILLWLFRRHRNRSKIYLSREAVKPRAFFTKPMHPAVLPNEGYEEPHYVLELQRPRAPVKLENDTKDLPLQWEGNLGLENDGFTDIPLEEVKFEGYKKNCKRSQEPPKYNSKARIESDTDSGIKLWSSTGSLYTASPELTHCSVPPPPYSPSICEEPLCLSVHSLPSLSKKLGLGEV